MNRPKPGEINRYVGDCLARLREERGWSCSQAEDASNGRFRALTLRSHETGYRGISLPTLASYAEFYGVEIRDLLPGVPQPPLVAASFAAITGAARSGVTEQIRQRLLCQAELEKWDAKFNGALVIAEMAELIGGPL